MSDPCPAAPPTDQQLIVQSIGSGSSGNALLVRHGDRAVLVDCGIGIREIGHVLGGHGIRPSTLDAVLLTHEHGDHTRGLDLVLHPDTAVVATLGTAKAARIPAALHVPVTAHAPVSIGDIQCWALAVRHDAADPCGFFIETPAGNLTVLTDLGCWRDHLTEALRASDLVIVEANHDLAMLRQGPYPAHLKRRVASDTGHLSNADCALALISAFRDGRALPEVWLAHLSATNNTPTLASGAIAAALDRHGLGGEITALPRRSPGPVWSIEANGPRKTRAESVQLGLEF